MFSQLRRGPNGTGHPCSTHFSLVLGPFANHRCSFLASRVVVGRGKDAGFALDGCLCAFTRPSLFSVGWKFSKLRESKTTCDTMKLADNACFVIRDGFGTFLLWLRASLALQWLELNRQSFLWTWQFVMICLSCGLTWWRYHFASKIFQYCIWFLVWIHDVSQLFK